MYITLTRNGEVSYWLNNTRYIQKRMASWLRLDLTKSEGRAVSL